MFDLEKTAWSIRKKFMVDQGKTAWMVQKKIHHWSMQIQLGTMHCNPQLCHTFHLSSHFTRASNVVHMNSLTTCIPALCPYHIPYASALRIWQKYIIDPCRSSLELWIAIHDSAIPSTFPPHFTRASKVVYINSPTSRAVSPSHTVCFRPSYMRVLR